MRRTVTAGERPTRDAANAGEGAGSAVDRTPRTATGPGRNGSG